MKPIEYASPRAAAWVLTLAVAWLALATPLRAQNIVSNPGFETGDFTDWTQAGNPGFTFVSALCTHSGSYGACLGPVGAPGYLLQQLLATQTGHTYDISFWLEHLSDAVAPDAIFNVYWGDAPIFSSLGGSFHYTPESAQMVALFPGTQLRFEFREDPAYWSLDDISVRDLGVVPEPASIALLGTGMIALYGAVRRRRGEKQI